MATYQHKPTVQFEANRYETEGELVPGMKRRDDGTVYITNISGFDVDVSLGDWIVQEPDEMHEDHSYACADAEFQARFEPAR